MTIGQRIAQKRKELALSQEALGAELGVSRQSIYKWESDSALPEIDKLIALCRLFDVTVGWLLGVEEMPSAPTDPEPPEQELTEAQLHMVQEITDRYLAALPIPKKRRKWPWLCATLAVLAGCAFLSSRLDQLTRQYNSLQSSVSYVQQSVNSQIDGISNRVEELLKAQNDLTAEYGTELIHVAPSGSGQGTAVFSAYAVPKTYVEGMKVEFRIQDHGPDGGANVIPVEVGPGRRFSTDAISCELTDEITLSAVFLYPDGAQETQVLDTYTDLYTLSLPQVTIMDYGLFGTELPDGTLTLENQYVTVSVSSGEALGAAPAAEAAEIQLGVFRNQALWGWAEPCSQPASYHGDYGGQFYRLPDVTLPKLSAAETISIVALVTDTYGRQFMACDIPYIVSSDGDIPYLTYPTDGTYDPDPSQWTF